MIRISLGHSLWLSGIIIIRIIRGEAILWPPDKLAHGAPIGAPSPLIIKTENSGHHMTYKEAITITYNFTKNTGKKDYNKTDAEMKAYADACFFLKAMATS